MSVVHIVLKKWKLSIVLVGGCRFSEKDGLDFIFIWVQTVMIIEIGTAGSGMDEHKTSPRGTDT